MQRLMILFLLLGSLLFSACNRQENAVMPSSANPAALPVHGDTIVSGMIGDATNLLPVLSSDSASSEVSELVYNGLVRYDKNLKLEGELAKSWEVSPG
jgi:peptide/nickel transport system substrate-binding protein